MEGREEQLKGMKGKSSAASAVMGQSRRERGARVCGCVWKSGGILKRRERSQLGSKPGNVRACVCVSVCVRTKGAVVSAVSEGARGKQTNNNKQQLVRSQSAEQGGGSSSKRRAHHQNNHQGNSSAHGGRWPRLPRTHTAMLASERRTRRHAIA
jgi:hypothetical protein